VLNGYKDWFLPSIDELHKLHQNKTVIGGFANVTYWSSSEFDTMLEHPQGAGHIYKVRLLQPDGYGKTGDVQLLRKND
jgi:hypothetical protein